MITLLLFRQRHFMVIMYIIVNNDIQIVFFRYLQKIDSLIFIAAFTTLNFYLFLTFIAITLMSFIKIKLKHYGGSCTRLEPSRHVWTDVSNYSIMSSKCTTPRRSLLSYLMFLAQARHSMLIRIPAENVK